MIPAGRQLHQALTGAPAAALPVKDWIAIGRVLAELRAEGALPPENAAYLPDEWNRGIRNARLASFTLAQDAAVGDALIPALARRPEVRAAALALEGRSLPFEDLAAKVFPNATPSEVQATVTALISVGILAKPGFAGAFPLLPVHYHLAASGVEGVALRLAAAKPEPWSEFIFARGGQLAASPAYSLLVCRNCGEPYVEAWDDSCDLHPRPEINLSAARRVMRLTASGSAAGEVEDDGESEQDDAGGESIDFDRRPVRRPMVRAMASCPSNLPSSKRTVKNAGRTCENACHAGKAVAVSPSRSRRFIPATMRWLR